MSVVINTEYPMGPIIRLSDMQWSDVDCVDYAFQMKTALRCCYTDNSSVFQLTTECSNIGSGWADQYNVD